MASLGAYELEQQKLYATIARVAREAIDDDNDGWMTLGGVKQGDARATATGGQHVWWRQYPLIRDRDEGRYYPFYEEERDLLHMRNKCRRLSAFTSVAVGALQALEVYVFGGEWEHEVIAREGKSPPPGLVQEANVILKAILDRNDFIGDLHHEINQFSREDGETLIAAYATRDGLVDFRRIDADQIKEPAHPGKLDEWLGIAKGHSNWRFGVHCLLDPRMRRIDYEKHAGYHVVFDDGGTQWDYLPAWPQHGDRELEGRFGHLIKRNTPRRAKRGISDFWPILTDLEREDKLSENLSVGAAIMAAIPWFEHMPKGTTRDQAESQLTRGLNAYARALTAARGGERTNLTLKPGSPVRISSGREMTMGPLGQIRQPIYIEVCSHLLRRIGLRWNFPEYMISGDASNTNFASTLVAESPFVKAREADQQRYTSEFKQLFWKSLKMSFDAGRFRRFAILRFATLMELLDIVVTAPMVASRDKPAQLEELRDLWQSGLLTGNEYRIDLKREPKPEYEQKTGEAQAAPGDPNAPAAGGYTPQHPLAAAAKQISDKAHADAKASQGPPNASPPGGDPNAKPGPPNAKPPKPGAVARLNSFARAAESVRTLEEARAAGRRIITERNDCGANAEGGGGFQPGNDCARQDGGGEGAGDDDAPTSEELYADDPAVRDAIAKADERFADPKTWPKEIPAARTAEAASAQAFVDAQAGMERSAYLTQHTPESLQEILDAGGRAYLTDDGRAGYVINKDGDLQNLFNNGGPRGTGLRLLADAIANGAQTLDCFDGHLPRLYNQFGFEPYQAWKFNDDYAPAGWNYERDGRPNVVFMRYQGSTRNADDILKQLGTRGPYRPVRPTDPDDSAASESVGARYRSAVRERRERAAGAVDRKRVRHQPVVVERSECGANAQGGGGFQPGNTCGAEDGTAVDSADSGVDSADADADLDEGYHDVEVDPLVQFRRDFDPHDIVDVEHTSDLPTDYQWKDRQGNWLPERQQLHEKIIGSILDKAEPVDEPEFVMMGGGTGAGKSSILKGGQITLPASHAHIDADAIKDELPEFDDMVEDGKPWAAAATHEESSYVASRAVNEAYAKRVHTVLDSTGDSSLEKLAAKLQKARDAGYKTRGVYVTTDIETAVERNKTRYENTGRWVPPGALQGSHKSVSRIVPRAIKAGLFDSFELWHNENDATPVKIAAARGTKLEILDSERWEAFLSKG